MSNKSSEIPGTKFGLLLSRHCACNVLHLGLPVETKATEFKYLQIGFNISIELLRFLYLVFGLRCYF